MKSIGKEQNEWSTKMNSLISLLMRRKSITIIVGEQVGWSLVSEYKIGNTYIERIGELQKRITKISKDTESSTATYIVIGLLVAATIIPLATWWYFSK